MRLVIDKDISEVKLLQESWEKSKPTYKVVAVNEVDRFVYAKGLKSVNEAVDATYEAAWDNVFDDCHKEIVEVVGESERTIFSTDNKVQVCESVLVSEAGKTSAKDAKTGQNKPGLWDKVKGAAKAVGNATGKALKGLAKGMNIIAAMTKQFSKDMLKKWREAGYFNKEGRITGLGYKVMTGEVKNTIPVDTGNKNDDITQAWKIAQSNVVAACKKQGMTVNGEVKAIVKTDKDPITLSADITDKDGNSSTIELNQDGTTVDGDAQNAEGGNAGGGNNGGGGNANTQKITPEQAAKNPKAALGNLATRVAKLEQEVGIAAESWNFNDEQFTSKAGIERLAIKRFFNEINDPSVKEIVFVSESGERKVYSTSTGSTSYVDFKRDFRESTDRCARDKEISKYKVTFESTSAKSGRRGFKFSDFGMADDFDAASRTLVIKESVTRVSSSGDNGKEASTKKEVVKESTEDVDARFSSTTVDAKSPSADPEPSGFELEVGELDPKREVEALLNSMNKYNGVEAKKPDNADGTIDTGVSTYPDVEKTVKISDDVVTEAEGDEGGDDAGGTDDAGGDDPFGGGDAGGGDEGGGEADPFAGGDEGGDAGGDEADPFGGGDDAGGDAGGDAGAEGGDAGAEGGDAVEGADAGAEGGDDASGEPTPEPAINTDAQGNAKSQYNINVTRPFNSNDEFSLNEEEQKEFFGKIDELVKIPDMDNYSLYLYQITPENMNLDDVHYIQALYQLSVKLGLLVDMYADSNLLEKYNSYKYSVVKDGEGAGEDEFKVQEQKNPIWGNKVMLEAKDDGKAKKVLGMPTVQTDNEEKNKESKEIGASEKDDGRRGPKDMKLDLDKNGAPKPRIIDTRKDGWEKEGREAKKLIDGTVEGAFHGLGWIVTFKAMQFGSPRFMSMYIKRKGDEKAEKQCEEYLKKLSYTEIEILNLEEIDPYEYIYRQGATGMKTPEEIATAKVANKDMPYLESSETPELPTDIKRDVKRVITKLNAEIRGTKQFNFLEACGVEKPQIVVEEFLAGYKKAQVNETLSETTYKFVFQPNDNMMSRMLFSNLKEKLFKYFGTFATKYNMECGCEATPNKVIISFMRSDLGGTGYNLDTMVDTIEQTEQPA